MSKRRNPSKPRPVVLGRYRARVARGPRDDGRFYWRLTENRAPVGCTWASRDEIEQELAKRIAGVPVVPQPTEAAPKTLKELAGRWVALQASRTDIEPCTLEHCRNRARLIIRDAGSWKVEDIPRRMHELRNRPYAKSCIREDLKMVRRMWRWGEDHRWFSGRLPRVPLAGPDPQRSTPTKAEALMVEAALAGDYRIAHAFLRVTGCRGVAVQRLRWDAVNLRSGLVKLTGKRRKVREVPIPASLMRLLKQLPDRGERVFSSTVCHNLRIHIHKACDQLDIDHYSLHGLRRLRVRGYRRAGVPVRVAADLLGHSPETMLKMYDESSEDDKRNALRALWELEEDDDFSPPQE